MKCVQCYREMELWGVFEWKKGVGENSAYICKHPECPNYGLLQVGEE